MNLTAAQLDRATGVLLASACGDALGAGYEFTYPAPGTVIDLIGGGPFGFDPGEWTDDTSMSVAVARVCAEGLDLRTTEGLDAVARGFLDWFDSGPKDIGNQTQAVLGKRDSTAAAMRRTAAAIQGLKGGNGSLMRTSIVGVAYLEDESACVEAASLVSSLTHDDLRAEQACRLWSSAIRHAVLTGTFDGVHGYLDRADAEEEQFWRPLLAQAENGVPADFPKNGWVVHALQTAWWAITSTDQTSSSHLAAALEQSVRAGHDTDTTTAIAGGLLGARWGASAVPARWQEKLFGWPGLRGADLIDLGRRTAR
ncbi:ADP-ribosylglycohydrolase family protein [Nakamurella silvestris]|nr:ADP-ribosylglycohydrolase family protein [Nakamurella silvestris]